MKQLIASVFLAGALALGFAGAADAGRVGGPGKATDTVQGFDTRSFKVTFEADKAAIVRVHGDGDTRLTLEVYDSRGNLVGKAPAKASKCGLSFTPTETAQFTLKVVNTGGVPNRFVIQTN